MLNFPGSTTHEFCSDHTASWDELIGNVTVVEAPGLAQVLAL